MTSGPVGRSSSYASSNVAASRERMRAIQSSSPEDIAARPPLNASLLHQPEGVHDDRLVDLAASVLTAPVLAKLRGEHLDRLAPRLAAVGGHQEQWLEDLVVLDPLEAVGRHPCHPQ